MLYGIASAFSGTTGHGTAPTYGGVVNSVPSADTPFIGLRMFKPSGASQFAYDAGMVDENGGRWKARSEVHWGSIRGGW